MYFEIQILILLLILMIFHYNNSSNNNEKFLILDKYLRHWPGDRFSFGEDYFVEFKRVFRFLNVRLYIIIIFV